MFNSSGEFKRKTSPNRGTNGLIAIFVAVKSSGILKKLLILRNLLSLLLLTTGSVLAQTESQGVDLSISNEVNVARFDQGQQANTQFSESFTFEVEEEQTLQYMGTTMLPNVQNKLKESKKLLVGYCSKQVFVLLQQRSELVSDPSPPV